MQIESGSRTKVVNQSHYSYPPPSSMLSNATTALPMTSESEPISFYLDTPCARVDDLLELSIGVEDCHSVHRHRRRSRSDGITLTLENWEPQPRRRKVTIEHLLAPRVTFYPSADIKPYDLDLQYEQAKSYSKEDYESFSKTMYLDVVRIKRYVQSKTTSKQSILRLIKNDILLSEEVRGIEHLLMCKTFSNVVYQARRDHVRDVLSEQKRLAREANLSEMSAQFSASRSSKSATHARIRAYT